MVILPRSRTIPSSSIYGREAQRDCLNSGSRGQLSPLDIGRTSLQRRGLWEGLLVATNDRRTNHRRTGVRGGGGPLGGVRPPGTRQPHKPERHEGFWRLTFATWSLGEQPVLRLAPLVRTKVVLVTPARQNARTVSRYRLTIPDPTARPPSCRDPCSLGRTCSR